MAHGGRPLKVWRSCMRSSQALISTALLASMVVVVVVGRAEAVAPNSGSRDYRFELTHVDANQQAGLSSDELMSRAIERSRLRAATLYGADSPAVRSRASVNQRAAEYLMTFYMGVRKVVTSAMADTGSNLIWVVQGACDKSATKSLLPCSMCHHANCHCVEDREPGGPLRRRCTYSVKYGGGEKTNGVMRTGRLTFPVAAGTDQETFNNVAIGCSADATVIDNSPINGIVGLGRGAQSLPGQLHFTTFSYCLSSYSMPERPSWLLFRTVPNLARGATGGAAVATTGLRRRNDDRYETWYFVDLQGISIGGTRLDITLQQSAGGNMFVDLGASFTHLEESAFNKVVETVDQIMKEKQHRKLPQGQADDMICYSSSTNGGEGLPQMVLHLADSADMVLPWDSYLWHDTKGEKLCLAILKASAGMPSVLGNFQQQGIHMLFDNENDKLSFVPADDCSKV